MIMSSDPFRIEYDSNNLNKQNKSQECLYLVNYKIFVSFLCISFIFFIESENSKLKVLHFRIYFL